MALLSTINKENLISEAQSAINHLSHAVACLSRELESRQTAQRKYNVQLEYPKISDNEDDILDLSILTQLIGQGFDGQRTKSNSEVNI